ncbi:Astryp1, partial [Danaus plexippus plexippus]
MWRIGVLLILSLQVQGKLDTDEDTGESGDRDSGGDFKVTKNRTEDEKIYDSEERIGAAVTQISRHPYTAALLKNETYVCSAIILNTYWLLTLSKCFESDVISSYVTHRYLGNYTIRTGSSYNNKGGTMST